MSPKQTRRQGKYIREDVLRDLSPGKSELEVEIALWVIFYNLATVDSSELSDPDLANLTVEMPDYLPTPPALLKRVEQALRAFRDQPESTQAVIKAAAERLGRYVTPGFVKEWLEHAYNLMASESVTISTDVWEHPERPNQSGTIETGKGKRMGRLPRMSSVIELIGQRGSRLREDTDLAWHEIVERIIDDLEAEEYRTPVEDEAIERLRLVLVNGDRKRVGTYMQRVVKDYKARQWPEESESNEFP